MPTDRPKPRPDEEEAGAPAWMVTFADMMTLLLCFFALLLSFSHVDATKYQLFIGSIKDAFGTTMDSKLTAGPWPGNSRLGEPERSANAAERAPVADTQLFPACRIK